MVREQAAAFLSLVLSEEYNVMIKSRKQNSTTYPQAFFMADSSDHVTGKVGLSPTVTLSKNSGSFAAASGAVSEIGNGWYSLAGNATDRNTLGEQLLHAEAGGADDFDGQYSIVDFEPFVFKPPVTLAAADVSGNVPVDVSAIQSGLATPTNITAASGVALSTDGIKAIWDFLTVDVTAAIASFANLFKTNIDAKVSEAGGGSGLDAAGVRAAIGLATANLDTQLTAILEDTSTTIPGLINADSGAGAISHVYTLTDSVDGTPIDGAEVWVTTDAAGVNVVASGTTNSSGIVTFMLDAGTYYFWRRRSGYNFINPDTETVA
jgi:hypothetical protein